jgi:hypothetical protein
VGEHPWWCSPAHCYHTEEGVRVHVQAPACWEQVDDFARARFETCLVSPDDEPSGIPYLALKMRSTSSRGFVHTILPLGDARRLRDQLSAHLDAAESGRRNRVVGVAGHLLMSSDESPSPSHPRGTAPSDPGAG